MEVAILSSSSNEVDDYYKSIARSISKELAGNGYNLVFGGSNNSMMGVCYDEFVRQGRQVYAFTTEKYVEQLEELKFAKHYIKESTFDMKKGIYENSDLIVVLPGGIGTLSELLSYIEENRSGNRQVPIEVYDENGYYEDLFLGIDKRHKIGFISDVSDKYFNVSHNYAEFIDHLLEYMNKEKGMRK